MQDFRKRYDRKLVAEERVRAALARLGGAWEYESDFAAKAGVTRAELHALRAKFKDLVVRLDAVRVGWAGTPAFAKAMRERL